MFNAEFNSWFSTMWGCTCCYVKSDAGITYIAIFDDDEGASCNAFTGE